MQQTEIEIYIQVHYTINTMKAGPRKFVYRLHMSLQCD